MRAAATPTRELAHAAGYRLAAADGGVFAFGNAPFLGSSAGRSLSAPIVGIADSATGLGYWLAGRDGGVFSYGDAGFFGSFISEPLGPVVGIGQSGGGYEVLDGRGLQASRSPNLASGSFAGEPHDHPFVGEASPGSLGSGDWLVTSDGGVFTRSGPFLGSLAGKALNAPIVGITATAAGIGYWLVAADGGVFSFGDAVFHGSLAGHHLNAPIVAMAPTLSGEGYWLAAADGGVFSFGDAAFYGSMGASHLNAPVVGMTGA